MISGHLPFKFGSVEVYLRSSPVNQKNMQPENQSHTIVYTPHGEIIIRQARMDDTPAFRTLRLEALRSDPTAFSADYEINAARPEFYFEERLKELGEGSTIYFAVQGEKLIGMTGIHRGESPKTQHSAQVWGVYVRPDWRGLRIADALLEHCIKWGRAHGVIVARLGVAADNMSAIRCYTRCGFTVYGLETQSLFYEGVMYDELLMSRLI